MGWVFDITYFFFSTPEFLRRFLFSFGAFGFLVLGRFSISIISIYIYHIFFSFLVYLFFGGLFGCLIRLVGFVTNLERCSWSFSWVLIGSFVFYAETSEFEV